MFSPYIGAALISVAVNIIKKDILIAKSRTDFHTKQLKKTNVISDRLKLDYSKYSKGTISSNPFWFSRLIFPRNRVALNTT